MSETALTAAPVVITEAKSETPRLGNQVVGPIRLRFAGEVCKHYQTPTHYVVDAGDYGEVVELARQIIAGGQRDLMIDTLRTVLDEVSLGGLTASRT